MRYNRHLTLRKFEVCLKLGPAGLVYCSVVPVTRMWRSVSNNVTPRSFPTVEAVSEFSLMHKPFMSKQTQRTSPQQFAEAHANLKEVRCWRSGAGQQVMRTLFRGSTGTNELWTYWDRQALEVAWLTFIYHFRGGVQMFCMPLVLKWGNFTPSSPAATFGTSIGMLVIVTGSLPLIPLYVEVSIAAKYPTMDRKASHFHPHPQQRITWSKCQFLEKPCSVLLGEPDGVVTAVDT